MQHSLMSGDSHYLVFKHLDEIRFFESKNDYLCCFDQMLQLSTAHEVCLYAWCMRPSEVHVLVASHGPVNDISRFIRALACRVTARKGLEFRLPWRVSFWCCPVEDGPWLLGCMRYIEALPNRSGGEDIAEETNSYYLRAAQSDRWILEFPARYYMLGRTDDERFETWRRYMRNGSPAYEREAIQRALRLSDPIGSEIFARRCRKRREVVTGPSDNGYP